MWLIADYVFVFAGGRKFRSARMFESSERYTHSEIAQYSPDEEPLGLFIQKIITKTLLKFNWNPSTEKFKVPIFLPI